MPASKPPMYLFASAVVLRTREFRGQFGFAVPLGECDGVQKLEHHLPLFIQRAAREHQPFRRDDFPELAAHRDNPSPLGARMTT